jgi:hypothetical protein
VKKLDRSQSKNYTPVVLWADDIASILDELSTCKDVELVADDVRYDSVDEFIQHRNGIRPRVTRISASDPSVLITLQPNFANLLVMSSTLISTGILTKIDAILARAQRKPQWVLSHFAWVCWLCTGLTWATIGVATALHGGLIWLSIPAAALLVPIYVGVMSFRYVGVVHPVKRESRPGFWKRNQDRIVVGLIAAVLGAVVVKGVDWLWPATPPAAKSEPATTPGTSP